MTTRLPAGPYRTIPLANGPAVPYYIVPFDKKGTCSGPATRAHLIDAARAGAFTDIFLFAHGWNNDWSVATERYEHFLEGYMDLRVSHHLGMPAGYKPLLVGVFWPSAALAFGENENGPDIAGGGPAAVDAAVAEQLDELALLAENLDAEDAARLYELAQKASLNREEALKLAELLKPVYSTPDDELGDNTPVVAEELLKVWSRTQAPPDDLDDFGTVVGVGAGADAPQAAFIGELLKKLDPRPVLRVATVYKMKDRAGTVGARGVSPLLRDLLGVSDADVHLIGHSYGAKIILSAAAAESLPRQVESMLLLQPAVSHLCFAERVPETDRAGGYRVVLERVKQPILSTFSRHDVSLTKAFHLALRRDKDLGEPRAAGAPEPPSLYAALGGFGPRASGEQLIDMRTLNAAYELDPSVPIYGLRGDEVISGHGDISNDATWWALYSLVSQ